MELGALQSKLESIYEVQLNQRIGDFLTTDQQLVTEVTSSDRQPREQVLVQQEGADLWLSLYLDREVYASFSHHSVPDSMCSRQTRDFCLAAEGVSHFIYLCWNANYDREVTQLEMELQAEVDKYLLLSEYVQEGARDNLHPWLFDEWKFEKGLSEEQHHRYENANRYARKYCWGLQQRYLRMGRAREMTRELRRFYRKTQDQKIRMIDSLQRQPT